jgi:hypothetical protein
MGTLLSVECRRGVSWYFVGMEDLKETVWSKMRQRLGDEYVDSNAGFLEAQWEWAKELGMIEAHGCEHPGIPVVWGRPRPSDLKKADGGQVYIGGCVIADFTRWCPTCEVGF